MKDIVIIGAGPAGMTAAIYAARAGKSVLLFEKDTYGGQIINSSRVDNYPGVGHVDGFGLVARIYEQLRELNITVTYEEVIDIKDGNIKQVITNKTTYECKSIIIATGLTKRKLNLPNEEELIGKGISYCATCDGAFYRNCDVAILGGGNTAFEDANFLVDYCHHVYLINRSENFKAEQTLIDRFKNKNNSTIITNANVTKLIGVDKLEQLELSNGKILNVSGLFIAIGQEPNCNFDIIEKNNGYIVSDERCLTNKPGIFVAGDIRTKNVRQLVTATSDGATSAIEAIKYIQRND